MVGVGNFPQYYSWVTRLNHSRMTQGDVPVHSTVDQKYWNGRIGCGFFRGKFLKIEIIFPLGHTTTRLRWLAASGLALPMNLSGRTALPGHRKFLES